MGDICEICKQNPAKIQIDGKHSFCLTMIMKRSVNTTE